MSKTLGNVIDPLDTIKEFGTDALRFTLALGTAGQVCFPEYLIVCAFTCRSLVSTSYCLLSSNLMFFSPGP